MATAAREVRRVKPKRRKNVRLVVVDRGKELPHEEGKALLLDLSAKMDARRLQRRLERTTQRHEGFPERQSVAIAMLAVEERLVKAFWTIARQPLGSAAPHEKSRCGIDYLHEPSDTYARYFDAPDKKYWSPAPRPSLPKASEIDAANAALDWLLLIDDEELRKLLVIGATSKRGDAARGVPWVRLKLPERLGVTSRTCQRRYDEALRIIANALTLARIA